MPKLTNILLAGLAAAMFAGAASAQALKVEDLPAVVDASRNNEARFERDYKGRIFEDIIDFAGMERPTLGGDGYNVRLGNRSFLYDAQCRITDRATVDRLIDKNVGDLLKVKGIIERTAMGVVILRLCVIYPQ